MGTRKLPLQLFYSYAHKDETLRDELETHLALLRRQGIIASWHDRRIMAGEEWASEIDLNIMKADIILLLISADFIASDYCWDKELIAAMQRHETREARVIPIILRPCEWGMASFGKLQALPTNAKPVTTWDDRDQAWLSVSSGIRRVAEDLVK